MLLVAAAVAWSACSSRDSVPFEPAVARTDRGSVGLVVHVEGGSYVVDTKTRIVALTFMNLRANRCRIKRSCYAFTVVVPPNGTGARAPTDCAVHRGSGLKGTTVECPDNRNAIFRLTGGGTWYGYRGIGNHAQGPCPSKSVAVYSASESKSQTTVEAWDECRETIVCVKARRARVTVQADTFDVVRGKCASVTRA